MRPDSLPLTYLDEGEPNDSRAAALTLAPSDFAVDPNPFLANRSPSPQRIPYVAIAGDSSDRTDTFSFQANAGTRGVFSVFIPALEGDRVRLTLSDAAGRELASDVKEGEGIDFNMQGNPFLRYTFPGSGTYYLTVENEIAPIPFPFFNLYNLELSLEEPPVEGSTTNVIATSGLFARSQGSGPSGNIQVSAPQVLLQDRGQIAVSSQGSSAGGSIALQAQNLTLADQASIDAETVSADGGNINLNVDDLILLRRNSRISATAGTAQGAGNGGNININAGFIVAVPQENSDITANAFAGNGGNITITADGVFGIEFRDRLTPESDIIASSEFGINGNVTLNVLDVDPSRGLSSLPVDVTDSSDRLQSACEAIADGSTFTVQGRGGLPDDPSRPRPGVQTWQDRRELSDRPTPAAGVQLEELDELEAAAPVSPPMAADFGR